MSRIRDVPEARMRKNFNPNSTVLFYTVGSKAITPVRTGGESCWQPQMRWREMSQAKVLELINLAQSCPFLWAP